ncbi:MAG: GGDEF domain-containing protein [Alphaproteobacteria bacterium]|nr:MAG: GGDEF domain-containing protein [Alphaproteobacteria bacterium]
MHNTQSRLRRLLAGGLQALRTLLVGPQILAFVPAITLAGFWYGGEGMLVASTLFLPALMGLVSLFEQQTPARPAPAGRDPGTGLALPSSVEAAIDEALETASQTGRRPACLALAIDEAETLRPRLGETGWEQAMKEWGWRLQGALRGGDIVARDGAGGFAVALSPTSTLDLEALIQIAARLQEAIVAPVAIGGQRLHATASVGFCLPREAAGDRGAHSLRAARAALRAARLSGPGSIRAHVPGTDPAIHEPGPEDAAEAELAAALDAGQIVAWFQPQICTDTGAVSGMEALARWVHPERGVIAPAAFLPMIRSAGLQRKLTDRIVAEATAALRSWDEAGLDVPRVAVNFSHEDLADPMLAERLRWALDAAAIAPARLVVEVLETVISETGDDIITRSVTQLAELGCPIDLDDFGTGHAAIAHIRRFRVNRIKIDRSLVTRVDSDVEQRKVVAAILELAARLGVETLAEGVETVAEHAILAQLGCGHVQGYGIARPMPLADSLRWLSERRQKTPIASWPGRAAG